MEYRYLARQAVNDRLAVYGLAVPYDQPTRLYDGSYEKVAPDAFRSALAAIAKGDRVVKAFRQHHPERILGRTDNASLRLVEAREGLYFEVDLPETTDGHDVLVLARRGDLGASIGFNPDTSRSRTTKHKDADLKVITECDLHEVSLTAAPAYPTWTRPGKFDQAEASRSNSNLAQAREVLHDLQAGGDYNNKDKEAMEAWVRSLI